ncbi:hypothetical protein E2C01_020999 [Portunus trituberculatus]|uniref:Uncharacterized protein n=1 Tax=Portunus trituberculatus TaxID=210409 RepID=A0A5B7E390_PORTR|nr:hypothetical protein [Portunus trituberculatus]
MFPNGYPSQYPPAAPMPNGGGYYVVSTSSGCRASCSGVFPGGRYCISLGAGVCWAEVAMAGLACLTRLG